ncbi:MAG: hypothetical protein HRT94_04655 [Alphaproteobacteria bacterium]|nr:hypothetical protein [Alphaproteobacteria bacterium]
MGATLTKEQIEHLHTKLVVPVAVGDILTYGLTVEPDMQYGMHEALSEIDPDSALLAIALSAQQIAGASQASYPIASALYNEATDILNDYGPGFIRDLKRGSIPEKDFIDILVNVPEDLEALADILDALCADIIDKTQDEENPSYVIARILSIQARAHMEIASFILEEAEKDENRFFSIQDSNPEDEELFAEDEQPTLSEVSDTPPLEDNIILFPIHLRN